MSHLTSLLLTGVAHRCENYPPSLTHILRAKAWRIMALLSEKLRDRIRNQGRVEATSEWRKWLDRYEEARRKGEPFDEPPPDRRSS